MSHAIRSIIVAAAALALPLTAHAEVVGTAGAANVRTTGTPPGAPARTIEIGAQIVHNERIETSASGSLHVIFIDKTTLNVGPNSSLVIDSYVYNPATGTGEMAATLGRGVLRIVGGQVTHTGGATITTPVATVGIRGGVATIAHCAATGACGPAGTRAVNHFGTLTFNTAGGGQTITRPGFGANAQSGDAPPAPPQRVSQNEIDSNNNLLTSQGPARGGAGNPPTDRGAANAGLGSQSIGLRAPDVQPRQPQTTASLPATGQQSLGANQSIDSFSQVATQGTQQTASTTATLANPARGFLMTTTAGAGSSVPFLTASFVGAGAFNVSAGNVYGYHAAAAPLSAVFQASLGIAGSRTAQTSSLAVMTGAIFPTGKPADPFALSGSFQATALNKAGAVPSFAAGTISSSTAAGTFSSVPVDRSGVSVQNQNSLFASGAFPLAIPSGPVTISQNATGGPDQATTLVTATPAILTDSNYQATNYNFQQTLNPATTPASLGADNSSSFALKGFVGGLASTGAVAAGTRPPLYIVTNQTGSPDDVSIAAVAIPGQSGVDASTPVISARFNIAGVQTSSLTGGSPLGAQSIKMPLGVFVDTRHFAAVGGGAYDSANSAAGSYQSIIVSSDAVDVSSAFPGVNFCQCDYTRWGFWSLASIRQASGGGYISDQGHLLAFVGGVVPNAVEIPTTGTATYAGHVIATIADKNQQFLAASNFAGSVNFATRTAGISVPNLDGVAYAGNIATSGTQLYGSIPGTALSSTSPGPTMKLNGSFFRGVAGPAGEMGGSVQITAPSGLNYLGSGIFAAKRAP